MTTHTCPDCDSGDGNCSVCHGKGKTLGERISDTVVVLRTELESGEEKWPKKSKRQQK